MLSPEEQLVGAQLGRYIYDKLYWVLHAPRQTGKTTFLQSWMREINAGGEAIACYMSLKPCKGITDDRQMLEKVKEIVLECATGLNLNIEKDYPYDFTGVLFEISNLISKPFVVLFDDVDSIERVVLARFLSYIRSQFNSRNHIKKFPASMLLSSVYNVKSPNPDTPFNIVQDACLLRNFTLNEIEQLFAQHTAETGQQITQEALNYVWEQSKGQPWIVNSLFARATSGSAETVTIDSIREARQQMIEARETHLDSLSEYLQDPKIKDVVQTIMSGADHFLGSLDTDVQRSMDLGLITYTREKGLTISNPIYKEILTLLS
jgi:hypothetical protein